MPDKKKLKKFLVVGLGPIGGIFACHMKAKGNFICGLDVREDYIEAIKKEGIKLTGLTSLQAKLNGVATDIKDLKEKEFDYVIVATKTPYMQEIVPMLKTMKNKFSVISMQNGIDNEEYLARFFGKEKVLLVVVNFAGNVISPGTIKMTFFHKPNYVGCICGEKACKHAQELADFMTHSVLDTEPTDDIKKFAWRKTILVAALAPISALLGMTMAEVMALGETHYLVEMLLKEAIDVAKAADYDYGEEFFDHCLDYLSTAGHHKPSMLIDIEKGDPTEIEYINGKISFYGHKLNLPAPLNTSITSMIKAKELMQKKKDQNKNKKSS